MYLLPSATLQPGTRPCGVRETPLTCPLTVWLMTQMAHSAWLPYLHLPKGEA